MPYRMRRNGEADPRPIFADTFEDAADVVLCDVGIELERIDKALADDMVRQCVVRGLMPLTMECLPDYEAGEST